MALWVRFRPCTTHVHDLLGLQWVAYHGASRARGPDLRTYICSVLEYPIYFVEWVIGELYFLRLEIVNKLSCFKTGT
jgi:hypothetical protein